MSQRAEKYARNMERRVASLEEEMDQVNQEMTARDVRMAKLESKIDRAVNAAARREKRERQEMERRMTVGVRIAVLCLATLLMILLLIIVDGTEKGKTASGAADQEATQEVMNVDLKLLSAFMGQLDDEGEDPLEAEKIEAALLEQGYFSEAIPLSFENQDFLQTACREFDIPYSIALAMVERETQFQNVAGDGGESIGYMQVKPACHADRMELLGVTDLWDPYGNFRVGCSYLAELLGKYGDMDMALMAYNMGPSRASRAWERGEYQSEYSREVIDRALYWEQVLKK